MRSAAPQAQPPPAGPAQPLRSLANRQARDLITLVGNQSNLILDPDLDSCYAMSTVILRYPELVDVASQIGDLPGTSCGKTSDLGSADRTRYFILEGRLVPTTPSAGWAATSS